MSLGLARAWFWCPPPRLLQTGTQNRCRQGFPCWGWQAPPRAAYVFAVPLRSSPLSPGGCTASRAASSASGGLAENGAKVSGIDTPSLARHRGQLPGRDTLIGLKLLPQRSHRNISSPDSHRPECLCGPWVRKTVQSIFPVLGGAKPALKSRPPNWLGADSFGDCLRGLTRGSSGSIANVLRGGRRFAGGFFQILRATLCLILAPSRGGLLSCFAPLGFCLSGHSFLSIVLYRSRAGRARIRSCLRLRHPVPPVSFVVCRLPHITGGVICLRRPGGKRCEGQPGRDPMSSPTARTNRGQGDSRRAKTALTTVANKHIHSGTSHTAPECL